jgi:hypothetical protein
MAMLIICLIDHAEYYFKNDKDLLISTIFIINHELKSHFFTLK